MTKSPEVRLILHLMTLEVNSLETGIKVLKDVLNRAMRAKETLQKFRSAVRSAPDADPNWTDTDIDVMIINRLNETLKEQGKRPI